MNELLQLCDGARRLIAEGEPAWLATVVRVQGSAYRHPGSRLLFATGRAVAGAISGGCLEADVIRRGPWLCETRARVLTYDNRGDSDLNDPNATPGSGCDGSVDILIERLDPSAPLLPFIRTCFSTEQRGVVVTVTRADQPALVGARLFLDGMGNPVANSVTDPQLTSELEQAAANVLMCGQTRYHEGINAQALVELIEPAPHLFVFGSGPDARALVELAQQIGWTTSVCGADPKLTLRQRFFGINQLRFHSIPESEEAIEAAHSPVAVVMSHSFSKDREALARLLVSRARYIGVLGPRLRLMRLLDAIAGSEASSVIAKDRRLYGPVGLNIGARTPQEIALSILAEAQGVLNSTPIGSLRDRDEPIHEPLTMARNLRTLGSVERR